MCMSADDVNPLCDECFAKDKAGLIESEDDLCEECQAMLKCYCGCCLTMYPTPEAGGVEHGICEACRKRDEENLCDECLVRLQQWDCSEVFEPCPKCQAELDAQMAPTLVRIVMPGENRPESVSRGDGRDTTRPRSVLDGPHKTAGPRQD